MLDQFGLPDTSDGPERYRGGPRCRQHHDGSRTGLSDWCCCCNPCLYERSSHADDHTVGASPWELRGSCCRCYPLAICMMFTPDDPPTDACCREFTAIAFPEHLPKYSKYTFSFAGSSIVISVDPSWDYDISSDEQLGPCYWNLVWEDAGISDSVEIDHTIVTCLSPSNWSITGILDSTGCVGTLTFSTYSGHKLPFVNRIWNELPRAAPARDDVVVPASPCNCDSVAPILCVSGVRHAGGDDESVEFTWDESLGDRWSYLPPCGSLTTDREVIYLRGDAYGNCYLELDFEQSGSNTNDWADPPNTLGDDEQEVRDGMILMEQCSCRFFVQSESTGGRAITITAGMCARFKYPCETCRCVPHSLCLFGEIDGVLITEGIITWDESLNRWTGNVGGFDLSVGITEGGLCPDQVRPAKECVGTIDNTPFVTPFANSLDPVLCGQFMGFELYSEYDPENPSAYNWLWLTSGHCGCMTQRCGICAEERCGGPPKILYWEYEGTTPPLPGGYQETCTLSVVLHYWERWRLSGSTPVLECGYFGQKAVVCEDTTILYTVEIPPDRIVKITFLNMATGDTGSSNSFTFDPPSCDPIYQESEDTNVLCGCLVSGIVESITVISE